MREGIRGFVGRLRTSEPEPRFPGGESIDSLLILRGLAAGLVATGAMVPIELAARSRWGLESLLDWQINQAMVARLTRRPPKDVVLAGLAMHALHGLVAGLVFVVILAVLPAGWPFEALGLGYGVVLFGLTLAVVRPITGSDPASAPHATAAVAVNLATHLVYGAVLAFLLIWPA